MKKENKKQVMQFTILIALALVLSLSLVSASQLLCLGKGEKVKFSECNPAINDYTCTFDFCQICVRLCSNGAFGPSSPNGCNSQGNGCIALNDTDLDKEPPVIDINNPQEGSLYIEKSPLLDIELDETGDIYYTDNLKNDGKWTRVCTRCNGYDRKRTFKEGLNNLTFRATDPLGNSAYYNLTFFIDTKKPKITKIDPRNGLTSGSFYVEFREDNPLTLTAIYNASPTQTESINLEDSCIVEKSKHSCSFDLDFENLNNKTVRVIFNLTDIAGNSYSSKPILLKVDTTFPVINSLDYELEGLGLNIITNITEANFDDVSYIDNSDPKSRWKRLCSSLKNGICQRKITLRSGNHSLDIQVTDDAGNSVAQNIQVII